MDLAVASGASLKSLWFILWGLTLICWLRCWEVPCSSIRRHICGYLQRNEQQTRWSVQRMPQLHYPSRLGQARWTCFFMCDYASKSLQMNVSKMLNTVKHLRFIGLLPPHRKTTSSQHRCQRAVFFRGSPRQKADHPSDRGKQGEKAQEQPWLWGCWPTFSPRDHRRLERAVKSINTAHFSPVSF